MPKPCSLELRERVVDAVEFGASRRAAAEWFNVSPSSAIKWMQRRLATGSIAAKPSGGSISPLEAYADFLLALIARQPDLVRNRRGDAQATDSGSAARCGALSAAQISVKKKSAGSGARACRRGPRSAALDGREQGMFNPARLVFIDETSTNTAMVRLRGRCPRGERLIGRAPQGHWKTITFVAGLRHDKMVAPFVIDGR